MPNPYDREFSVSVLLEHIQDINAAMRCRRKNQSSDWA